MVLAFFLIIERFLLCAESVPENVTERVRSAVRGNRVLCLLAYQRASGGVRQSAGVERRDCRNHISSKRNLANQSEDSGGEYESSGD